MKSKGVRLGNWLTVRQAQTLLMSNVSTKKALRDPATLAVLLGSGFSVGRRWRRSHSRTFSSGTAGGASWIFSESAVASRSVPIADVGQGSGGCVDRGGWRPGRW